MKERDTGLAFKEVFADYHILTPINSAQAGWPDRLIQLPNSRAVASELKHVKLLKSGNFRLSNFRPDQAAWLAKWQRAGGLCFLFMSIDCFNSSFGGYGIFTVSKWRDWLLVANGLYAVDDLALRVDSKNEIKDWFAEYTKCPMVSIPTLS